MLPIDVTYPDAENVEKRARPVHKVMTYDDLCKKREQYGEKSLSLDQYIKWRRHEGWEGDEPDSRGYYELLTNTELYIHCRRFMRKWLCLTCQNCPPDRFWMWLDGIQNPCFSEMDEVQMQAVETEKSPERKFDLVSKCPLWQKADDRRIYEDYISSPLWREIRRAALESSPYCFLCGRTKEDGVPLVVHHKSYKHIAFEDEYGDIEVLCAKCHSELHADPEPFSMTIQAHKRRQY